MVKKIVLGFVLLLLAMQIVLAVDTEITVKTLPDHRVDITALVPGQVYSRIDSFHETSNLEGKVTVILTTSEDTFNLKVWVKKDNVLINNGLLEDGEFSTGESLELEVYPDWYTPPVEEINETEINETEEVVDDVLNDTETNGIEEIQEETSEESELSGAVISGEEKKIFSMKSLSYVGGFFVVLLFSFFILFMIKKMGLKNPKEIKVRKLSELNAERKEKVGDFKDVIENAEKKIDEAQREIKKLKNDDKIKEMKRKIEQDRKELEELEK